MEDEKSKVHSTHGVLRNEYKMLVGKNKSIGDLDTDGRTILNWVLNKKNSATLDEYNFLRPL
jgi:hypothetical protein